MNIRELTKESHQQLKNLVTIVEESMENRDWLISFSEEELDGIFDDNNAILYGFFDNKELLAISGLFFDESDFTDIVKLLGIEGAKVAEIGESMTLPEKRGNNYMLKINKALIQKAKSLGFEYLIATAHPNNAASNISLKNLEMNCLGQINRYGKYLRNCYMIKI